MKWQKLQQNGTLPNKLTYGHTITGLDDSLFLFGGTNGFDYYRALMKYNLITREWQNVVVIQNSAQPEARYRHTCALVNN